MIWVESVDSGASRTTPNSDFLVEREDLDRIVNSVCQGGWIHRVMNGWHTFAESDRVSFRSRVRLVFANELVRPDNLLPAPSIAESYSLDGMHVIALEALIRMKLTAYRTVDRVHLDDLLSVDLYDPTWLPRFPPALSSRLQQVFDDFEVWPDKFDQAMADAGFTTDEQLSEFIRRSKENGERKSSEMSWFLARESAHLKVRVG